MASFTMIILLLISILVILVVLLQRAVEAADLPERSEEWAARAHSAQKQATFLQKSQSVW